jgi:hypothetical protein
MKAVSSHHGHWYCGRWTLTRGLWQLGFTQDLMSFKMGISVGRLYIIEVVFAFWSLDISRLTYMDSGFYEMKSTPPDIADAINRDLFKLL